MTEEQAKSIRELAGKPGNSVEFIAHTLGLKFNTVYWYLKKNGIKTVHAWTRPLAEARKIYLDAEKFGLKKTAERYGITVAAVKRVRCSYLRRVNKEKGLGAKELAALRTRALRYVSTRATPEIALDFVSWITIYAMEGKAVGDLATRYIDYLRHEFGTSKEQQSGLKRYVQVGDSTNPEEDIVAVGKADPEPDRLGEFLDRFDLFQNERLVIYFLYKFGISQGELACALGVVESRVSQIHTTALDRIRKQL